MKATVIQPSLFPESMTARPEPKRPAGGSSNPIVFHDYESFIAKFQDREKTTDDTYTPRDVFEAVVRYVGETAGLAGREILRPFYPGGDYERAEYPADGVVIDNPPFSIFTRICRFYSLRHIPFFIFGPALTVFSCCRYCTAVIADATITFDNRAAIRCNFASNLFGDTITMTAPRLRRLIAACPSQDTRRNLPSFVYPPELLSVSDMQTICAGGINFSVSRSEAAICRNLDLHPKRGLFGDHLLISSAKASAKNSIPIVLSPREARIVAALGTQGPAR